MRNRFTKTVDSLPFVGKYSIGIVTKGYIRSDLKRELPKLAGLTTYMGVMVVGHALQTKLGYDSLSTHMQSFTEHGDVRDLAFSALDSTYLAANAAVSARQGMLFPKIHSIHRSRKRRQRRQVPSTEPIPVPAEDSDVSDESIEKPTISRQQRRRNLRSAGSFALAFSVTLGGQIAFARSLYDATELDYREDCVVSMDKSIKTIEQDGGVVDQSLRQEWASLCGVDSAAISLPGRTENIVHYVEVEPQQPGASTPRTDVAIS